MSVQLVCSRCGEPAAKPTDWHCIQCGGPLEIADLPQFDAGAIQSDEWSLWRYAAMLPVEKRFSLGAGMTPLVQSAANGNKFYAKMDYLNPTGSYKDRGTSILINYLLSQGVKHVVEDSSGNAGSSVAMYASGAGMTARIYVPAAAPAAKKRQIAMSAEVVEVGGTRRDVTDACLLEVENGDAVYASHAWNPLFIAGQMTAAWELWEQFGRDIPDAVVIPVGQGLYLLGYARGFESLLNAGLVDRLPRIFAVQAAACDPIVRGFESNEKEPIPVEQGQTVADGIVISNPVRGSAVLEAIRRSRGAAVRVQEDDIHSAWMTLAKKGLFVEPTSATTLAALPQVIAQLNHPEAKIVLALTGHGLKSSV